MLEHKEQWNSFQEGLGPGKVQEMDVWKLVQVLTAEEGSPKRPVKAGKSRKMKLRTIISESRPEQDSSSLLSGSETKGDFFFPLLYAACWMSQV